MSNAANNAEQQQKALSLLKATSWFKDASESLLMALSKIMEPIEAEDGDIFLQEDEEIRDFFVIEEGVLARTKMSVDTAQEAADVQASTISGDYEAKQPALRPSIKLQRRTSTLQLKQASIPVDELFGRGRVTGFLHAMEQGDKAFATVAAQGRAKVWRIDGADFRAVMGASPQHALDVLHSMARELRVGTKSLRSLIQKQRHKKKSGDSQHASMYRDLFSNLTRRNVTILVSGSGMPHNYVDDRNQLITSRVEDAALMWASWLARLTSAYIALPKEHFIELSNEPNGNWSVQIEPSTWTTLACRVRDLLDDRGLHMSGISGPGASIGYGAPFFTALQHADALRCLAMVSVHTWEVNFSDPCGPNCTVEKLIEFDKLRRQLDPNHTKVWAATEYGTRTNEIMGTRFRIPVQESGPTSHCYANASVTALPAEAESLSPLYGARVVALTLAHMNTQFDATLYWWLRDYSWAGYCFGLTSRNGQSTAAFQALQIMFNTPPFTLENSIILDRIWQDDDTVQSAALQTFPGKTRVMLWIAYMPTAGTPLTQERSYMMENLPLGLGGDFELLQATVESITCYPTMSDCNALVLYSDSNSSITIDVNITAGSLMAASIIYV